MSRDWTKYILSSQGTILSSKVKMIWPSLFEAKVPRGEKDESKKSWNTVVLVPKGHDMSVLIDGVNAVVNENLTEAQRKTTKIKKPFRKVEDLPSLQAMLEKADLDPADFQCFYRTASKKFKPTVVAANGDPVDDETQEYSGRWMCVSQKAFWWKNESGGVGVSIGLNNVQLLDHDDVLAGGRVDAQKEFEAVGDSAGGAASVFD